MQTERGKRGLRREERSQSHRRSVSVELRIKKKNCLFVVCLERSVFDPD